MPPVRALRVLHVLSLIIAILTVGWLLMVFVAASAPPQKTVTVLDQGGKVIVAGEKRVVFRPDHWWRDVLVKTGAPSAVFLMSISTLWYSTRRLYPRRTS